MDVSNRCCKSFHCPPRTHNGDGLPWSTVRSDRPGNGSGMAGSNHGSPAVCSKQSWMVLGLTDFKEGKLS